MRESQHEVARRLQIGQPTVSNYLTASAPEA